MSKRHVVKQARLTSAAITDFQVEQCTDCDGGYYCGVEGATNVTGLCAAGYYCERGVDINNPHYAQVCLGSAVVTLVILTGRNVRFWPVCILHSTDVI